MNQQQKDEFIRHIKHSKSKYLIDAVTFASQNDWRLIEEAYKLGWEEGFSNGS